MSVASISIASDIKSIRENYDTTNPMVAEIIKLKEQRLRILQELNKQQEQEFSSFDLQSTNTTRSKQGDANKVKKSKRKSDSVFPQNSIRRSARLLNSPKINFKEEEDIFMKSDQLKTPIVRPPNDYGSVPGVEVGYHWETRMECSMYGVHRPTVAGIHGGPDGAYSIALSGGYPEDVDDGYSFIYTGAGGRDLKGTSAKPKNLRIAPQTKDQQLEGTNLSLVKSIESQLPIRVIRGYKSPSIFAPETGYRYDGLYQVVKYWEDIGKSGHRIYRFRMERMSNQAPPPWEKNAKPINSLPKKEFDTTGNNEESKENIRPTINNNDEYDKNHINEYSAITLEDAKDINVFHEIEECIKLFCKFHSNHDWKTSKINSDDTDFLGWDGI